MRAGALSIVKLLISRDPLISLHLSGIDTIGTQRQGTTAGRFYGTHHFVRLRLGTDIGERDHRALPRQANGNSGADTARTTLHEGDFVGEIALVTGEPRTATVVALQRSDLLALDLADFRELAGKQPELTQAIEREAARRLGALPVVVAAP